MRLGFSGLCVVAAILLILLWVRSYFRLDILRPWGHDLQVFSGEMLIDETWIPSSSTSSSHWNEDTCESVDLTETVLTPAGTGITIPFWLPTVMLLSLATIAALPWIRWRFSLRTLLIATTFLAAILGLIVVVTRQRFPFQN